MLFKIKKVLIAAGGTGGHLFPAIALAEELRKRGIKDILFVCSSRPGDRQILDKEGYRFSILKIMPIQKGLDKFLIFLVLLLFSLVQAGFILLKFRPQVCVGFGGYVSLPLIFFAKPFGIRTIIHEQNFIPGRANRFLSNFAKKVAISFEETKKSFPTEKTIFTGNPVRRTILNSQEEAGFKFTGFDKTKFTILVMGGSQGAYRLNTILPEALSLLDRNIRENLQVIHLTGGSDEPLVEKLYNRCGINCRVFKFSDKVGLFYRISKLVIARAGATTIAELVAMRIPSILIPYPYANGHQRLNAKFLEGCGAAVILEEDKISPELLSQKISQFLSDNSLLSKLHLALEKLTRKDASAQLCEEVLNWEF